MANLLVLVAHNSIAAVVMSLGIHLLSRCWRNPSVIHLLWVIVLLKLIAPPVVTLNWEFAWPTGWQDIDGQTSSFTASELESVQQASRDDAMGTLSRVPAENGVPSGNFPSPAGSVSGRSAIVGRELLCLSVAGTSLQFLLSSVWLCGAVLIASVTVQRIRRFDQQLRQSLPPPVRLQHIVLQVATKMGLRHVPRALFVESVDVPFIWCAGWEPAIVLPIRLFNQLDDQSAAMIVAHELAHLRRRDHWTRFIELFVAVVYWWNPLVSRIRSRLHEAEDICCDGWVRRFFPNQMVQYADVLLQVAESLNGRTTSWKLLPTSPLFHRPSLKERIEMIMKDRFAGPLCARHKILFAAVAIAVLPLFLNPLRPDAHAASDNPSNATQPEVKINSGFPFAVRFEQGETKFLEGDSISIVEVRGTSETMTPGELYSIKGTYKLASSEKATLSASVTAAAASDGTSRGLKVQSTSVGRGQGEFTLYLPMTYKGWPHVSFYPAEGGNGFGGSYFGTGESVLMESRPRSKPNDTNESQATSPDLSRLVEYYAEIRTRPRRSGGSPNNNVRMREDFYPDLFPHLVPFELGETQFENGNSITIQEVRGTANTIALGNFYMIKGTYTLNSHQTGMLAAYTTASEAQNGTSETLSIQECRVQRGEGAFMLILPMWCKGWPHIGCYAGRKNVANVYFGTGDSLKVK